MFLHALISDIVIFYFWVQKLPRTTETFEISSRIGLKTSFRIGLSNLFRAFSCCHVLNQLVILYLKVNFFGNCQIPITLERPHSGLAEKAIFSSFPREWD